MRLTGEFARSLRFVTNPRQLLVGGKRALEVSQVLNDSGAVHRFEGEPGFAALRGTYTHEAIALWLRGKLDLDSLDERIVGPFEGARLFLREYGIKPALSEQLVAHLMPVEGDERWVVGMLDLFGFRPDGHGAVIDFKVGQITGTRYAAQLGGYAMGLEATLKRDDSELAKQLDRAISEDLLPVDGMLVQLRDDGTYRVREVHENESCGNWISVCREYARRFPND